VTYGGTQRHSEALNVTRRHSASLSFTRRPSASLSVQPLHTCCRSRPSVASALGSEVGASSGSVQPLHTWSRGNQGPLVAILRGDSM
jgi:hypothetical protein